MEEPLRGSGEVLAIAVTGEEPLRGSGEVLAATVTGKEPLRGSGVGTFVGRGFWHDSVHDAHRASAPALATAPLRIPDAHRASALFR